MGADLEAEHGGYPAFAELTVQPIKACRLTQWVKGLGPVLDGAADSCFAFA
jgi:hypothetical protein